MAGCEIDLESFNNATEPEARDEILFKNIISIKTEISDIKKMIDDMRSYQTQREDERDKKVIEIAERVAKKYAIATTTIVVPGSLGLMGFAYVIVTSLFPG